MERRISAPSMIKEKNMVGIFFAQGFEEVEALTVVDLLRRAGIDNKMISVTGESEVTGSHDITVKMDERIENISFDELDAIVLPGGNPGFPNLEKCELLKEKTIEFSNNEEKLVAAICGAPSVLGHWGVLNGIKACVYPGMDAELIGAKVSHKSVVTDGHIITSRGMGTAIDFGLAIVEYYKGGKVSKELSEKIVY